MNVVYEQSLVDYMRKKGYTHISVEAISPRGCCADVTELCVSFVAPKHVEAIKAKTLRVIPGEIGEILILSRGLDIDENITLGLKSFFGIKDVSVKGIRVWTL